MSRRFHLYYIFFSPLRVREIDRLDQLMFFPALNWNVLKQRIQTIYVANCVHSFSKIQSNSWISHINCIFRSQELELIFSLYTHACWTHNYFHKPKENWLGCWFHMPCLMERSFQQASPIVHTSEESIHILWNRLYLFVSLFDSRKWKTKFCAIRLSTG